MTKDEITELANLIAKKMRAEQKEIMTADEAAEYMGLKKSYLYKLTMNRDIPHSKPTGKICYFKRKDLDDWMMRCPVKTMTELQADADRHMRRLAQKR